VLYEWENEEYSILIGNPEAKRHKWKSNIKGGS
jgi:hypothetical protein